MLSTRLGHSSDTVCKDYCVDLESQFVYILAGVFRMVYNSVAYINFFCRISPKEKYDRVCTRNDVLRALSLPSFLFSLFLSWIHASI